MFIIGNHVGGDNTFDAPMPYEKFCTWEQLVDLVANHGCTFGWHTWSHPDLTKLSDEEIRREVTPPFQMDKFAYPYGRFDGRVIKIVKDAGFKEAYGVYSGDNSPYQRLRPYLGI